MKDYTVETPVFSGTIQITETTDMAHADNINAGSKQLLENTLANRESIEKLEEGQVTVGYESDDETLVLSVG